MWESSITEAKSSLHKYCIRSAMSYRSECLAMKKADTRQTNAGSRNDNDVWKDAS